MNFMITWCAVLLLIIGLIPDSPITSTGYVTSPEHDTLYIDREVSGLFVDRDTGETLMDIRGRCSIDTYPHLFKVVCESGFNEEVEVEFQKLDTVIYLDLEYELVPYDHFETVILWDVMGPLHPKFNFEVAPSDLSVGMIYIYN